MKDKWFPAMTVGYALNHGAGTYRLYNPRTKRIIMSRDVTWMDFKSKQIESEFEPFEPSLTSEYSIANIKIKEDQDDKSSLSSK